MGARALMIMRALVERNVPGAVDPYGQPGPRRWQIVATKLPCRVWTSKARLVIAPPLVYSVKEPAAIFPLASDVRSGDRVTVTDRLGRSMFGPALVAGEPARRADHLACDLRVADAGLAG